MATGVNKVIVVGHLGQDPDTRYVPSGAAVTSFSVAVTEKWTDKTTGELKERTEWIDIEVWGKQAEHCATYLQKGSLVYVEGSFRTDSWEDRDTGAKKYRTKVHARQVTFLAKTKGNANERASDRQDQDGMPPRGSTTPAQDFDDDIPF